MRYSQQYNAHKFGGKSEVQSAVQQMHMCFGASIRCCHQKKGPTHVWGQVRGAVTSTKDAQLFGGKYEVLSPVQRMQTFGGKYEVQSAVQRMHMCFGASTK